MPLSADKKVQTGKPHLLPKCIKMQQIAYCILFRNSGGGNISCKCAADHHSGQDCITDDGIMTAATWWQYRLEVSRKCYHSRSGPSLKLLTF